MKFGAKLRFYTVPEWQQYYVDYKRLKSLLKHQQRRIRNSANAGGSFLPRFLWAQWDSR